MYREIVVVDYYSKGSALWSMAYLLSQAEAAKSEDTNEN